MKVCKVDGCNNEYFALGYCRKHYQKFKKYGDPLFVHPSMNRPKICTVEGCCEESSKLGYCEKHYQRYRKHGDPLYCQPKKKCSIKGCKNKHAGLGYCLKHYKKFRKYGDPLFVKSEQHRKTDTSEYYTWSGMKSRCYYHNDKRYKDYGGRGIKVCDRWRNSFTAFYEDMGKRPFPGAQIDRRDNDGNYEPGNCRWVSRAVNIQNQSTTKLTMEKAKKIRDKYKVGDISLKELALIYNVSYSTIYYIITNKRWIE